MIGATLSFTLTLDEPHAGGTVKVDVGNDEVVGTGSVRRETVLHAVATRIIANATRELPIIGWTIRDPTGVPRARIMSDRAPFGERRAAVMASP